jgi:hypothetical protein
VCSRFFTTFGSRTCMREVMPSLAA